LNFGGDGVVLKAVQRSVGSTTPNLTTNLDRTGRWLDQNLLHIAISINLYPPLHTLHLYPYPSGWFSTQINRGEHG